MLAEPHWLFLQIFITIIYIVYKCTRDIFYNILPARRYIISYVNKSRFIFTISLQFSRYNARSLYTFTFYELYIIILNFFNERFSYFMSLERSLVF